MGRNDCTWPTEALPAIHRDFLPDDLRQASAGLGLAGSVLVQSQASDLDTDWLCDLARDEPMVMAVVTWVDLASPAAAGRIEALARRPKVRGVRPMLQNLTDDDWILRPELAPGIAALVEHGLSFDALVFPRHLQALAVFADRWPDLKIVVDHGAKPSPLRPDFELWKADIAALARRDNVSCKLSGLLTELPGPAEPGQLAGTASHLLASFGPERLMWGSDWPVLNLAADYQAWHAMAGTLCGTDTDAASWIFGRTAMAFYRLPDPSRP